MYGGLSVMKYHHLTSADASVFLIIKPLIKEFEKYLSVKAKCNLFFYGSASDSLTVIRKQRAN